MTTGQLALEELRLTRLANLLAFHADDKLIALNAARHLDEKSLRDTAKFAPGTKGASQRRFLPYRFSLLPAPTQKLFSDFHALIYREQPSLRKAYSASLHH